MLYNIYFSPTGGTKKVSDIIADKLSKSLENGEKQPRRVDLFSSETLKNEFTQNDICVISMPVYAGRIPKVARERFEKIKANSALAILVAVFGNRAIDDALVEMQDIAESLGFKVIAGIEAVAEHSLARIYGKDRPDTKDREDLEEISDKIADKIQHGCHSTPILPGNRPYKEAKQSPMNLDLEDTCIDCKICAEECPVGAIDFNDVSIYDKEKCFSCLHCVAVCPIQARHNNKETTKMFEDRLRDRCATRKPNKLYI